MKKKIGFVGAGNMGSALICGAVNKAGFSCEDIFVHSLVVSDKVKELNINVTDLKDLVGKSDYIILCIKPAGFENLLSEIKSVEGYDSKIYISIAAGITIGYIKSILGNVKVIRTMPNLPLVAGAGMTVMATDNLVSDNEFELADKLFSGAGKTLSMDERLIDTCTAINGSGPAYVFMFIEALADAAVKGGIPRDKAYILAAQTVMGSALMQLETQMHPAALKDMVCSPGGTTIEAVSSLEKDGFRSAIISAVDVCAKKARDLGN